MPYEADEFDDYEEALDGSALPSSGFQRRHGQPPPPVPKETPRTLPPPISFERKPRGPFRKIVLWEKHRAASGKAILFRTGDTADETAEDVWMPTSQINHIHKEPALEGGLPKCTVECTEWILDQKGF